MLRVLIIGIVVSVFGFVLLASLGGWGLSQPKKQAKSVRHGSKRHRRSHHGFFFVGSGRSHGYYGGK